jgi:hypothetical protein
VAALVTAMEEEAAVEEERERERERGGGGGQANDRTQ